jgi:hypothetical protein
MGMVVVVLAEAAGDLTLGSEASSRLADLGVTYAAILTDDEGVAVVLEGRRFDASVSTPDALRAIGATISGRALSPIAQMSVRNE